VTQAVINATVNDIVSFSIPVRGGGETALSFSMFSLLSPGSNGTLPETPSIDNVIMASLADVIHITVPTAGGGSTVVEVRLKALLQNARSSIPVVPARIRVLDEDNE
jgi:hypothetical protein